MWGLTGEPVMRVDRTSAVLVLPNQVTVPFDRDHSNLVKFKSLHDDCYQSVSTHIAEIVNIVAESQGT